MQVTLNTRVPINIAKALDDYAQASGKSKAAIVAAALQKYLDQHQLPEKETTMKLHQMYIREFGETQYGECIYPFETDQDFDWFDVTNPNIDDVRDLLNHLGYDTTELKFSTTGIDGIGVTGESLDIVIGFQTG